MKKELTLENLLAYGSIDEIKNDILEKEIDSFRRESYAEQFAELERRFGIKTLRNFPEWPEFIEFGQRRNILTHNDGKVSHQYLLVCDRENVVFEKRPKLGDQLEIKGDYLFRAIAVLSKVGFMLAHTLWRKVFPGEAVVASKSLNASLYDLLLRKSWKIAAEFGEFGLSDAQLKDITEVERKKRVINTAIAFKKRTDIPAMNALLDREDWTATLREFKLANAVLKDQYKEAAQLMQEIGPKGEMIQQISYHDWPLFIDFQDTKEFQKAYKAIYKIEFIDEAAEQAKQTTRTIEAAFPSLGETASATTPTQPKKALVKKAETKKPVAKKTATEKLFAARGIRRKKPSAD